MIQQRIAAAKEWIIASKITQLPFVDRDTMRHSITYDIALIDRRKNLNMQKPNSISLIMVPLVAMALLHLRNATKANPVSQRPGHIRPAHFHSYYGQSSRRQQACKRWLSESASRGSSTYPISMHKCQHATISPSLYKDLSRLKQLPLIGNLVPGQSNTIPISRR